MSCYASINMQGQILMQIKIIIHKSKISCYFNTVLHIQFLCATPISDTILWVKELILQCH